MSTEAELLAKITELENRIAKLEKRRDRSIPKDEFNRLPKCHYVRENGLKILIPGCWGSIHQNDLSRCTCR